MLIGLILLLCVGTFFAFMLLKAGTGDVYRKLSELNLQAPSGQADSANAIHRMLDDEQQQSLHRKLQEAGWYDVTPVQFVVRCVVFSCIGLALGVLLMVALQTVSLTWIVISVVLAGCGALLPNAQLNRAIEQRKIKVQRELPDFLDVVTTTVEAGIALNGAMNIAVDALRGPLGEELRTALADIRLGRSRAEALAAMAQRLREPDLTTTVTAIIQAERLGGNIVYVLTELSVDARNKRMMRAEEVAATLPVKMVFPMALFMLPSLLIIIFGALAAQYIHI
jgi:tight adherence protein C